MARLSGIKPLVTCEILCDSCFHYLQQIFTGFAQLHKAGVIRLRQRMCKPTTNTSGVKVLINGSTWVYYDMHDNAAINEQVLDEVEFYFKRSFLPDHSRHCKKIFPYGLRYAVFDGRFDLFQMERVASFGTAWQRLRRLAKQLLVANFPSVSQVEAPPCLGQPPRVLLMTQLWGPHNLAAPVSPPAEEVNLSRATCIRLLRKEFGSLFFGGVRPDDFSRTYFSDVVLPDVRIAEKATYFKLLRGFPICVTTRGLHDSNGGRLAEYVALSKAVITEQPAFDVPGGFAPEANYITFSTPEQCVEAATRLMQDKELRHQLMINNFRYYQAYLRPDCLILNTLGVVLTHR